MRIGLNLLHALPEIGGGWNYIQSLISAIGEHDHQNTYLAFVTPQSECLIPSTPNFQKITINIPSEIRPLRVIFENTVFPLLLKRHQLDCIHWFSGTMAIDCPIPSVVTMYDLKAFTGGKTSKLQQLYLRWAIRTAARKASLLLPMSYATQKELQSILHVNTSRMVVIPPVIDDGFRRRSDSEVLKFCASYRLPDEFWLYVAHFYPHKNHLRLIQAYHALKKSGFHVWPLVLRGDPKGAETEIQKTIVHFGLESDVIFLPRLRQSELPVLYSAASALVFPSLYEGGGIPVIEAMSCGCPVTTSDIPAISEYAGDAAIYFNPTSISSMMHAMKIMQNDLELRMKGVILGLTKAEAHRASRIVDILASAYKKVQSFSPKVR